MKKSSLIINLWEHIIAVNQIEETELAGQQTIRAMKAVNAPLGDLRKLR
jgi:hypothetical protein